MSRTAVYMFKGAEREHLADLRNAWGFAPFIWDSLCEHYGISGAFMPPDSKWERLWAAEREGTIRAPGLAWWERAVLQSTYDKALIRGADLERFADACGWFHNEHLRGDRVQHTREIAELARTAAARRADALGFHATSVSENPWSVRVPDGDGDDSELEVFDARPYDLTRDTGHFFVDFTGAEG